MKAISSFMSRILPHVAGCPDVVAQEALVDTAIEFCEKTLVVQQTLDPVSTQAGIIEYSLDAPTNEMVVAPVSAWYKTTLLQPVSAQEIRNVQAYSVAFSPQENSPTYYFWTAPGTVGLYPIPSTSEPSVITVRAALKPTRDATTLEDVLYDDWIDTLVAGTLARLHMMKDTNWASADRALIHSREFRVGVQRARIESSMGRIRTSVSVRLRGF